MSELRAMRGSIGLSTAVMTITMIAQTLGLPGLPVGGSTIAQAAIFYLLPLSLIGMYFSIIAIVAACKSPKEGEEEDEASKRPAPPPTERPKFRSPYNE